MIAFGIIALSRTLIGSLKYLLMKFGTLAVSQSMKTFN